MECLDGFPVVLTRSLDFPLDQVGEDPRFILNLDAKLGRDLQGFIVLPSLNVYACRLEEHGGLAAFFRGTIGFRDRPRFLVQSEERRGPAG